MGTPWDAFSEASHALNAKGQPLKNRLRLRKAMLAHGFIAYAKEWWHFRYPMVGTSARDIPYGCFEAREWHFQPPADWNKSTYEPPKQADRDLSLLECVSQF